MRWTSRAKARSARGQGVEVAFKVLAATATFTLGVQVDEGAGTGMRLALVGDGTGAWRVQYNDGQGWRDPVVVTPTGFANTWYTLTLAVDDARGNTLTVYTQTSALPLLTYNLSFRPGQSWRFHQWTGTGTVYLDDYREFSGPVTYWPNEHQTFTYDSLDRLTAVLTTTALTGVGGYTATYAYSPVGNLLAKAEGSPLRSYTYPAMGQPRPHAALTAGSDTYGYDTNGNMTTRTENGIPYTQTFDLENRLRLVTQTVTNQEVQFYYNGEGTRVKKVERNGATEMTTTLYVGAVEIVIAATTRVTTTYYAAGAAPMAMRVVTGTGAGAVYYLHTDHLGSTSLTTEATGQAVARQSYYAYGASRHVFGRLPTDKTFTGQRTESYIQLVEMGARWYDADLGRFISSDAVVPQRSNPQTLNRYSYVNNSPLNYTDPTGHRSCDSNAETWDDCVAPGRDPSFEDLFGITFEGNWLATDVSAVHVAVLALSLKLKGIIDGSVWEAFNTTYGASTSNPMRFAWGISAIELSSECRSAVNAGCTSSAHLINFTFDKGSIYGETINRPAAMAFALARNNVVRELGHAFASRWWYFDPQTKVTVYDKTGPYANVPGQLVGGYEGFAQSPPSASRLWRQHPCTLDDYACRNETLADMFLGWTFDTWGNTTPVDRGHFMTVNMGEWVLATAGRP